MANLFTDRLLIYVDSIDEQHKKIFEIVEELSNACIEGCNRKKIMELFNALRFHAEENFKEEEEQMIKYNYPGYREHKDKHNIFIRKIEMLNKSIKEDYVPVTKIVEINEFFTEGFITHLSELDSKLGEFLKDKLSD